MNHIKQAILQSARIAELKAAAKLVEPRGPIRLSRKVQARDAWLVALLVAERRRNAALLAQLKDEAIHG